MGMPRALNVGNWLYFVALSKLDELDFEPVRALSTTRAAHRCFLRCHEGQALDLTLRISELKRAEVSAVARTTSQLKTGALRGSGRIDEAQGEEQEAKLGSHRYFSFMCHTPSHGSVGGDSTKCLQRSMYMADGPSSGRMARSSSSVGLPTSSP